MLWQDNSLFMSDIVYKYGRVGGWCFFYPERLTVLSGRWSVDIALSPFRNSLGCSCDVSYSDFHAFQVSINLLQASFKVPQTEYSTLTLLPCPQLITYREKQPSIGDSTFQSAHTRPCILISICLFLFPVVSFLSGFHCFPRCGNKISTFLMRTHPFL